MLVRLARALVFLALLFPTLANAHSFDRCLGLLASLRFYAPDGRRTVYSGTDYIHGRLFDSWKHIAMSILRYEYLDTLERSFASKKNRARLREALLSHAVDFPDLPTELWRRMRATEGADRANLLAAIASGDEESASYALGLPLKYAFDNDEWKLSRREKKRIIEDWSRYRGLTKDASQLRKPDGRIDLQRLMKVKVFASKEAVAGGAPVSSEVQLAPQEVLSAIFTLHRDAQTGRWKMNLSVMHEGSDEGDWRQIHHSETSEGNNVEYAGHIAFTPGGAVRGLTLESGHFMARRQDEINRFIARTSTNDAEAEAMHRLAAEKDRAELRQIVSGTLGLRIAPTAQILVRKSEWSWKTNPTAREIEEHPIRAR